ncbi:MAG TPA: hypothetical protein VNM40_04245 [Candidatus Paceibacterota bacterium]|nr:hypothetical protein [Candidatus Paceibacterota bacterium]
MPEERIAALERKIEDIRVSVEKTRQYLLWTLVVTLAIIVLPAVGLMFAIPSFIATYNETLESLDLDSI